MKLYRVTRKGEVGWDEYDSFIVLAENEDEARRLAQTAAEEGEWQPPANAFTKGKCDEVNLNEAGVVLGSFNAG